MLLSVPLAEQARGAGEVVFGCATVLTVCSAPGSPGTGSPGTATSGAGIPATTCQSAAGGLIAGGASASLGFVTLSHVLFGLGVGSYLLLGSIIGQRLFVVPELPKPLLPTIAIELAPPVVAANSWFAINGGRVDTTVAVISGFAVLMVLAQLRLIPLYRTAPFGPAYWAFSFPVAAAVTCGVHWLGAERVPGATGLGYAVVGLLSRRVPAAGRADGRRPAERHVFPARPGPRPGGPGRRPDRGPRPDGGRIGSGNLADVRDGPGPVAVI